MALSEFALIDRFFRGCGAQRSDVPLGIGDDAALLACPVGKQLVATIDTLVEGVHFPPGSPPRSVGHRALAVNLSDIAAMGAEPAWALLSITLPTPDESWLAEFSAGLDALARAHNVALVGGNTTSGPLVISVQLLGFVEPSRALLRSGGKPGDAIFVSGTPGDAAAGLTIELARLRTMASDRVASGWDAAESPFVTDEEWLRDRFLFPTPRVELGKRLLDYASACIDVSDGLFADVSKLANASGCGAELQFDELPVSAALVAHVGEQRARELALSGGENYELCFTVSPSHIEDMMRALPPEQWSYRRIGTLTISSGARVLRDGIVMDFSHSGWDHFGAPR